MEELSTLEFRATLHLGSLHQAHAEAAVIVGVGAEHEPRGRAPAAERGQLRGKLRPEVHCADHRALEKI